MVVENASKDMLKMFITCNRTFGGVSKSMLTLNEAIIDVKEG